MSDSIIISYRYKKELPINSEFDTNINILPKAAVKIRSKQDLSKT